MHLSCDFEHIAFVGGPCSGKTSVFEALRALPVREESNACLSFVGEAATQILPRDPTLSRRDPLFFQFEVSLWQYMEEDRGFERLISCCDKPLKVQITDRGVADAYIYLNEEQVALMTDMTPEELMHRYTTVLYFEPFRSESITDGNEFRVEKEEEMAELEAKTRAVWQRHPGIIFVPTFPTIEERIAYVVRLLHEQLGVELFDPSALPMSTVEV